MSEQSNSHPYVTRLENLSRSWTGNSRWADAPWNISNMYATTIRSALREDAAELKHAAIQYFPRVCTMMVEGNIELQVDMVNDVLTLLTKQGGLQELFKQPGAEQALAWFCCELTVHTSEGNLNNPDETLNIENFISLLETWSGRSFPNFTAPRVDNVVDFLYGEPCWNLYGSTVESSKKHAEARNVVRSITWSSLPLLSSQQPSQEAVNLNVMPDTLI